MPVSKRSGWLRMFLCIAAMMLCVDASFSVAAPASNAPKPQPSSSASGKKLPSKTSAATMRKSTTTVPGAQQPASPAGTTDKKTGERATGNQSSWPPPPAPRQFAPDTPIDTSIPPPLLPRASRLRMRACAEEWTKKKLLARNDLPRWRDFATVCLNRKDKP